MGRASACVVSVFVMVLGTLIGGCSVAGIGSDGVENPLSAEQARAQVVDAARDVVAHGGVAVAEASFSYSSCNDQDEPPFRGTIMLWRSGAQSREASVAENEEIAARLRADGWSGEVSGHYHGTVLQKNNVVIRLGPASPKVPRQAVIEFFGECRDMTPHQHDEQLDYDVTDEVRGS